jgi:hypothetical protein
MRDNDIIEGDLDTTHTPAVQVPPPLLGIIIDNVMEHHD